MTPATESEAALPGLPCAHHAGEAASWYCPACGAALCGRCVRVFPSREEDYASCKACGGMCRRVLSGGDDDARARRAAGVADDRGRRADRVRDYIAPAITVGAAFALHALLITAEAGPIAAAGLAALWLVGGTFAAALVYLVLDRFAGVGFDPVGSTLLRLAAAVSAVQAVRALSVMIAAPEVPEGGFVTAAMGALLTAAILALCLLVIPLVMLMAAVRVLFEADGFEANVTAAALLFATVAVYAAMKMQGMAG